MNTTAVRANRRKLAILAALVLLCAAGYMLVGVHFDNAKLFQYAVKIRTPKRPLCSSPLSTILLLLPACWV